MGDSGPLLCRMEKVTPVRCSAGTSRVLGRPVGVGVEKPFRSAISPRVRLLSDGKKSGTLLSYQDSESADKWPKMARISFKLIIILDGAFSFKKPGGSFVKKKVYLIRAVFAPDPLHSFFDETHVFGAMGIAAGRVVESELK